MFEIDERTKTYFEAVAKSAGHIRTNHSKDRFIDVMEKQRIQWKRVGSYGRVYVNSSALDIYKYESPNGDTRYCAELSYPIEVDDYNIELHIFDKYPSLDDVKTIRTIADIEFRIEFKGLKPEFRCYECGRTVHFVDTPGSFNKKVERLEERYCGC